jgi:polar amino acid transport system substrate-binding protein
MSLKKLAIPAVVAILSLSLTGCSLGSSAQPTASAKVSSVDSAAVDLLPADIKQSGELTIGVGTDYPPNESVDANGNPSGWGIELAQAIATRLGLKAKLQVADFDKIIPSIISGTYQFGEYSFTDNAEREKKVDFVNYYNAGIQWVSGADKTVGPNNACGLKIAVYATSYEDTDEIPASIVLGYMDYSRKVSGLGPLFYPTGDIEKDMVAIKAFYAPFKGKNPDQFESAA